MKRLSGHSLLIGLGLLTLVVIVLTTPSAQVPAAFDVLVLLAAAGVVAVCTRFPIILPQAELSLTHIAGLTILFTFGIAPALWTLLIGLMIGEAWWFIAPPAPATPERPGRLGRPLWPLIQQILPLFLAAAAYLALDGKLPLRRMDGSNTVALGAFVLVYYITFNFLKALEISASTISVADFFRQQAVVISLVEFLPFPLLMYSAIDYIQAGNSLLWVWGVALCALTIHLYHNGRRLLRLTTQEQEHMRQVQAAEQHAENLNRQLTLVSAKTEVANRNVQSLSRRAQQMESLLRIGQRIGGTTPPLPYDAILQELVDATGAHIGQIGLIIPHSNHLRYVAIQGLPLERRDADRNTVWLMDRGIVSRVLRTGQNARVANVLMDPDYVEQYSGVRSELCVLMGHSKRRIGLIRLHSRLLDAFGPEDESFVTQAAALIALVMENSRLADEAVIWQHEHAILLDAAPKLAATVDIRVIYRAAAQQLAEAIKADACTLFAYDEALEALRAVEPRTDQLYRLAEHPTVAQVINEKAAVVVRANDPNADPTELSFLHAMGMTMMLVIPMLTPVTNHVYGLARLYSAQPRDFTGSDTRVAQTLANQAAISIQNARMLHTVSENRDRLEAILNSTREGVLVIDAGGTISLVNPPLEEFWNVSGKRLIGQHLLQLVDDAELDIAGKLGFERTEVQELLLTLRAGLALSIPKAQFALHTPKLHYFERTGAPVLDQYAKAIGWVIILRDMTEEKELQQVRDSLSSMIVHDLRSPLTSMLTGLTIVRDRIPPEQKTPLITQAIDVSLRSCNKMLTLVNTLLDIARMETGDIRLSLSHVALHDMVDEVITDLLPLANDQGLVLINDVPTDLPAVSLDRDKISRVLTNLLDNALKFSPPGGQVIVRADYANGQQPPEIVCAVLDTGPGIPDDYRARIFDRFVQVEGHTTRRKGTGLGLAFCKLAIEAHGGKIWADNRPEGGSIFKFTLPLEHRTA
jgi:PAS domain S-box-containing protein